MPQPHKAWTKTSVCVVAGAALLTPTVCLWPDVTPIEVAEREIASANCDALEQEVETLQRRTRELDRHIRAISESYQAATPQPECETQQPGAASPAPIDPDPVSAGMEEGLETLAARFTREHEQERVDAQYSLHVTRAIGAQLARSNSDTRIESVECTSSICRCVLQQATASAQRLVDSYLSDLDLLKPGVEYDYVTTADTFRTTAYVNR